MAGQRRTKIVATIGPASGEPETLRALIAAGADVLRLNFSHATPDQHAEMVPRIREAAAAAGREVALLGDLPGPKIRVGEIRDDVVDLIPGSEVTLTTEEIVGDAERIPVPWPHLGSGVSPGDKVFMADGSIRLGVLSSDGERVRCEVEVGGPLASHKGLNLPGADTGMPAVSESDLAWVDMAVSEEIDLLAVSFVRRAEDLDPVKARLAGLGSEIPIIAKIEKPQAAEDIEAIAAAATGIMVARGDLGIELPLSRVPVIQKKLIASAGRQSRFVITATQMLASMTSSERPTRAEVTDVANAIFDGTDAVMLSEETAVGDHPIEAVRVMDQIARETEPELPYGDWLLNRTTVPKGDEVAHSVAQGAVGAAYRLGVAAIVVPTGSGRTARLVSAHRPRIPVLALSPRLETVRRLNVLFGVQAAVSDQQDDLGDLLDDCAQKAAEHGVAKPGELIAITAGLPGQGLGTNLFEVHRVP
jgi:pyruvate kinase